MLKDLTLENLTELDEGKVALMLQRAISVVTEDILDRPDDQTARKVVLTLSLKPASAGREGLKTAELEVAVKTTVPKLQTRPYECKRGENGGLQFNAVSPEDVNQGALPFPQRKVEGT